MRGGSWSGAAGWTRRARRSEGSGQRGRVRADPGSPADLTPARAEGAARGRGLAQDSCARQDFLDSGLDDFLRRGPRRPSRPPWGGTRGRGSLGYRLQRQAVSAGCGGDRVSPACTLRARRRASAALGLDPWSFVGFPVWCPRLSKGERKLALCWCGKKRHLASPGGRRDEGCRLSPTRPVRSFIKQTPFTGARNSVSKKKGLIIRRQHFCDRNRQAQFCCFLLCLSKLVYHSELQFPL